MAIITRQNSGLVVRPDHRGRLRLFVNGQFVVATKLEHHTEYDRNEVIVTIPARAITFEAGDVKADG